MTMAYYPLVSRVSSSGLLTTCTMAVPNMKLKEMEGGWNEIYHKMINKFPWLLLRNFK